MSKKIIGVDINEIIRARQRQFDKYYVEEFGEEGVPMNDDGTIRIVYDLFKEYHWEDTERIVKYFNENLPDNISPLDYQIDEETGKSAIDEIAFLPEKEKLTAKEMYNTFMYEDFLFEIFGSAPKVYQNVDLHMDEFFNTYKDQFELVIVSKENWFSIAPTLFFLSKLTPRFKSYIFNENDFELWDKVDIMITTDPVLLKEKPRGKKAIKITRPYNDGINSDHKALNLIDLVEDEEFQKLINFKNKKKNK